MLINGATGGVGNFAVQMAKAIEAHITVTCSSSNASLAKVELQQNAGQRVKSRRQILV